MMHAFEIVRDTVFTRSHACYCALPLMMEEFDPSLFDHHGIAYPLAIATSAKVRQRDFFLGRYCLREVMLTLMPELGAHASTIGIRPDGRADLPSGLAASITHCDGFAAAVCQPTSQGTIGIDAERIVQPAQMDDIAHLVSRTQERRPEIVHGKLHPPLQLTLIFSAKEALFKAIYPLVGQILDFMVVRLVGMSSWQDMPHGIHGELVFEYLYDLGLGWRNRFAQVTFYVQGDLVQTLATDTMQRGILSH